MQIFVPKISDVINIFTEAADSNYANNLAIELCSVDEGTGFVIQESQCRVCNHISLDVFPQGTDEDHLECSHCGCMAMQEQEPLKWEINDDI